MKIGSVFDNIDDIWIFSSIKPDGWSKQQTGNIVALAGRKNICYNDCSKNDPDCFDNKTECECDFYGGPPAPDNQKCVEGRWCIWETPPGNGQEGVVCEVCGCQDTKKDFWDPKESTFFNFKKNEFCPEPGSVTALVVSPPCASCNKPRVYCDPQNTDPPNLQAHCKDCEGGCGDDANPFDCGMNPTTCQCEECRGDNNKQTQFSNVDENGDPDGDGQKWCCDNCEAGKNLVIRDWMSKSNYQNYLKNKDTACICCAKPADGKLIIEVGPGGCIEGNAERFQCENDKCVPCREDNCRQADWPYTTWQECQDACVNRRFKCVDGVCEKCNVGENCQGADTWRTKADCIAAGTCTNWECDPNCFCVKTQDARGNNTWATAAECKGNSKCWDVNPCGQDTLADNNGACMCKCRNGLFRTVTDPCPGGVGPQGGFQPKGGGGGSPGGGGGDGGGDGGGEETSSTSSNPCGDNATIDSADGLCYCNQGYITMNGEPLCNNCAPGYVYDIYGKCCDPFNTPGGCDYVGGSLIGKVNIDLCAVLNCQEGCCESNGLSAYCRC